ncbi:hypothetical protein [Paenibacillus hamazuiensis]|uniref:DoxX family protein n=1 Tax=Paenibacillus hamazuiensis TaxID=2936508 RepID=UPI00200F60F0|nr:hypothetical protein [Paenibacillus hamazuiensis]
MAPLIALIASFLLFRVLGWTFVPYFNDWVVVMRFAVAVMFLLTASAHWGKRRPDLIRMVPPAFSNPAMLVTLTGWLEIAGAIGIVIPATAHLASIGLALLLIALSPANIYAAQKGLTLDGKPVTPLIPRMILQIVFLAAVIAAGIG